MPETRTIYLCGPIMDCCGEESTTWRQRAKEQLVGRYRILDPMRRNLRDHEVDSANEIVQFCLQDVRDADIILVNYSKPSVGTSMEVFHASHNLGKFVVAFSPEDYVDLSPWMVKHCTKILATLEEALDYIKRHFG